MYRAAGVSRIATSAGLENGGYTWAKLGFTPDQDSWDHLSFILDDEDTDWEDGVSARHKSEVHEILRSSDPKAIWALADHPAGKAVLCGQNWEGAFDLADDEAHARLARATAKRQ